MKIDIHAHYVPLNIIDTPDNPSPGHGFRMVTTKAGKCELLFGDRNFGAISRQMYDPEARVNDMDETGVDIQALSPVTSIFCHGIYKRGVDESLPLYKKQNEGTAEIVREQPNRFRGMATIPLQAPDAALTELDRAINKLGLHGLTIGSNVNGRDLDDPAFLPIFKEVQALDIPVFIHPINVAGSERMRKYYLTNLIGNPLDTTIAAASIVFGGILEKYPGLKFCLAHGGGYLPYQRGRWEHGYQVRPEARVAINHPPSYYLKSFYFDTVTHSIPALEYLVSSMGSDKVVMGTDYPYDMADATPVKTVNCLAVPEEDKAKLLGGNASYLLKIT